MRPRSPPAPKHTLERCCILLAGWTQRLRSQHLSAVLRAQLQGQSWLGHLQASCHIMVLQAGRDSPNSSAGIPLRCHAVAVGSLLGSCRCRLVPLPLQDGQEGCTAAHALQLPGVLPREGIGGVFGVPQALLARLHHICSTKGCMRTAAEASGAAAGQPGRLHGCACTPAPWCLTPRKDWRRSWHPSCKAASHLQHMQERQHADCVMAGLIFQPEGPGWQQCCHQGHGPASQEAPGTQTTSALVRRRKQPLRVNHRPWLQLLTVSGCFFNKQVLRSECLKPPEMQGRPAWTEAGLGSLWLPVWIPLHRPSA